MKGVRFLCCFLSVAGVSAVWGDGTGTASSVIQEPASKPDLGAGSAFERGIRLLQDQRYQSAVEAFERKAAADSPESFEVYVNWGIALVQAGRQFNAPEDRQRRFEAAAEKFAKATVLNPRARAAYVMWSEALVLLGDLPLEPERRLRCYLEAVEKCRRATELAPQEWDAYHKWGVILISRLADYARDAQARANLCREAAGLFGKATERARFRPDIAAALANWGGTLVQEARWTVDPGQKQECLRAALEKFEKSAQLQPQSSATFMLWGSALVELGKLSQQRTDFLDAIDKLDASLALKPGDPGVLYRLVDAYALLGNPVLALQNLRQCFDLDRTSRYLISARSDPDLQSLREDPDFKDLIRLRPDEIPAAHPK